MCVYVYEKCAGGDSNVRGIEPVLGKVSVEEMTFVVVLVLLVDTVGAAGRNYNPPQQVFIISFEKKAKNICLIPLQLKWSRGNLQQFHFLTTNFQLIKYLEGRFFCYRKRYGSEILKNGNFIKNKVCLIVVFNKI